MLLLGVYVNDNAACSDENQTNETKIQFAHVLSAIVFHHYPNLPGGTRRILCISNNNRATELGTQCAFFDSSIFFSLYTAK